MSSIALEAVMILLLVLVNGLLALAEFSLVSARKARLQQLAERGDKKAGAALELARNPGDLLSTVQIGITLAGVLAGVFGGATISNELAKGLSAIPVLAPYSRGIALGLVAVTITLLTLVLGELTPKRLALSQPERYAAILAGPMRKLARAARPLVRLLNFLTDGVLHILHVPPHIDLPVTEEELKVLIDQATQAGVFKEVEQDMLAGVLRLGDRRVGSLITPRTEIEWLDLEDPAPVHLQIILTSQHSRFPVGCGSLDDIRGVVSARDVLSANLQANQRGVEFDLKECLQPPVFIPENMLALQALEVFRSSNSPLLLVIDEFGGLQGLITINDLVESIVGDLPLEGKIAEAEIVSREDGSLLIDGMFPVDEFMDYFDLPALPEYDKGLFQTLGGFVMNMLGRIPMPGDHFEWNGLRFEVMDMDGMRIDKVLVQQMPSRRSLSNS
ncbi:MAG: hemolysin family protein [Anaerolineales bacterium]|nr:hemolysin family protein [Anaerolineales bacterium]